MISLDSKRRRSQKNIFLTYSDDCQLGEDKMQIFFREERHTLRFFLGFYHFPSAMKRLGFPLALP